MTKKHNFTIARPNAPEAAPLYVTLTEDALLALYAYYKLVGEHRVRTIRFLRAFVAPGLGLYDAKQIVDFMAEYASYDDSHGQAVGTVSFQHPTISYTCVAGEGQ
jgi:hypothetical protein